MLFLESKALLKSNLLEKYQQEKIYWFNFPSDKLAFNLKKQVFAQSVFHTFNKESYQNLKKFTLQVKIQSDLFLESENLEKNKVAIIFASKNKRLNFYMLDNLRKSAFAKIIVLGEKKTAILRQIKNYQKIQKLDIFSTLSLKHSKIISLKFEHINENIAPSENKKNIQKIKARAQETKINQKKEIEIQENEIKKQEIEKKFSKYEFSFNQIKLDIFSFHGVFSQKKLDKGTEFLLMSFFENPTSLMNKSCLDFGAGSGIIGLFLKKLESSLKISFSDINVLAIESILKNTKENAIKIDKTYLENNYKNITEKFDLIVANPPFHLENTQNNAHFLVENFINDSKLHLRKNGKIRFVVSKAVALKNILQTTKHQIIKNNENFLIIEIS